MDGSGGERVVESGDERWRGTESGGGRVVESGVEK